MSNKNPAQFDGLTAQSPAADGAQNPDPDAGQHSAQTTFQGAQAQIPPRPNVPFDHIDGKIILDPNERFCRIAFTSLTNTTGWQLCKQDELFTERGLREHLWTYNHFHWKRGDDIKAASSSEISHAIANNVKPQMYKLARTNEDIVRRGPPRTPRASTIGSAGTPAQANHPRGQQTSAGQVAVAYDADLDLSENVPTCFRGPPLGASTVRASFEYEGRIYVLRDDGSWHEFEPPT